MMWSRGASVVSLLAIACAPLEPVAAQPQAEAAPEPAVAEPQPQPQPQPEPEPEPEPGPVLSDGTPIEPCLDPPPPGMACIPGGPFLRGTDDGKPNTRPQQTVELQTYYVDLYEATNAEYKACKATGDCPRGRPLYNDFSRDEQPIVGPNWYAAVAFCKAHGKHLPTEAEWEKAARGTEGALHPWGDEPATCERAVIKDKRGRSCGVDKKMEHPKKGRTFVVGTRPAGVYGLYDMVGNAWEWTADWYSESYEACGDACSGIDPAGLCGEADTCPTSTEKVVRGGSWYWDRSYATSVHRRHHVPENPIDNFHHFGFRCAASVQEANTYIDAHGTEGTRAPKGDPNPEAKSDGSW